MPGGDRTGPMGMGPRTGRAAGYCAGSPVPGYMNPGFGGGCGFGRGRGGGRGRRNWFYATGLTGWQRAAMGGTAAIPPTQATPNPATEIELLKRQAEELAGALDAIRSRLDELQPQEEK